MLFVGDATGPQFVRQLDASHCIVCGNEKGGSGKSTLAMHLSVALCKLGFLVATIDMDTRQRTLSRYATYRRNWVERTGETLPIADNFIPVEGGVDSHDPTLMTGADGAAPTTSYADIRGRYDFIVFDTPGSYTDLSSFAHGQADTLITPINDSFIDFDVLANVDPESLEIQELAQYAGAVRDARRRRRVENGEIIDWVVLRNRMSPISSRNERRMHACLRELSMTLGFRLANGIGERVIFREWFQRGLTALDDVRQDDQARPLSISHLAARNEVRKLIQVLRLPVDDDGRRRAEARRRWLGTARPQIRIPDIFAS